MTEFRAKLQKSWSIVVVAGTSLSAALGITTFRTRQLQRNPSKVWQTYHYRREVAKNAAPNAARLALARFSQPQFRKAQGIASDTNPTLITQNIDGLSPRAHQQIGVGLGAEPTSPPVIEMHGQLSETICTVKDCRDRTVQSLLSENRRVDGEERDLPLHNLPQCRKCGDLLRPEIVWFGETITDADKILEVVNRADVAIVVGTSSQVYPAAAYSHHVKGNGDTVAVFNTKKPDGGRDQVDFCFIGRCEETLVEDLPRDTTTIGSHCRNEIYGQRKDLRY
ncbi:DHS-like NAD/FAD-binding domain-containing protein [Gyrodon lividus]|nr:DHS-like NAD/FAD-binding domain-containing protein [Gyrodon lividus]